MLILYKKAFKKPSNTYWVKKHVYHSGKLEKSESGPKPQGTDTSKLTTLTKAIDAIQENSKSLETMGK